MGYVFQVGQDVEIYLEKFFCWSMATVISDNFPGRICIHCKRGVQFLKEYSGERIVVVDRHLVRPAGPYPVNIPIFNIGDYVEVFQHFEWWEAQILVVSPDDEVYVYLKSRDLLAVKAYNLRLHRRWVPENDSWIPLFGVGDEGMYKWPPYTDDDDDDDDIDDDDDDDDMLESEDDDDDDDDDDTDDMLEPEDDDMLEPEDDDEEEAHTGNEAHGQAPVDFGDHTISTTAVGCLPSPSTSSSSSSGGGSPILLN